MNYTRTFVIDAIDENELSAKGDAIIVKSTRQSDTRLPVAVNRRYKGDRAMHFGMHKSDTFLRLVAYKVPTTRL